MLFEMELKQKSYCNKQKGLFGGGLGGLRVPWQFLLKRHSHGQELM